LFDNQEVKSELMLDKTANLDATGKIVLDHIYNEPDPRPYYSTLKAYDYSIPGEAAPVFRKIIAGLRGTADTEAVSLIDLGCSYGVNAAILKYGLDMEELYDRYTGEEMAGLDRNELIALDRDFYSERVSDPDLEFIGFDVAERAIDYAVESQMMDDGVATNLETEPVPETMTASVAGVDLVISTGCIGYVKQPTLQKILDAGEKSDPWMAHFVLRMFPFDDFEGLFAEHGYVTEKLPGTFRQRRFASQEEQNRVLGNLAELGIDPAGKEAEGWYHAEFHLSRPAEAAEALPLEKLIRH
jgi:hypothetical protein